MSKKIAFWLLVSGTLTGCVSDYQTKELEYRIKILERRMSLLEMSVDEALDSCP